VVVVVVEMVVVVVVVAVEVVVVVVVVVEMVVVVVEMVVVVVVEVVVVVVVVVEMVVEMVVVEVVVVVVEVVVVHIKSISKISFSTVQRKNTLEEYLRDFLPDAKKRILICCVFLFQNLLSQITERIWMKLLLDLCIDRIRFYSYLQYTQHYIL
jgi:hypothetical protein